LTQVLPTHIVRWGMEDYPRTLAEPEARFSTKETCREYLFHLRWANEFVSLVAVEEEPGLLENSLSLFHYNMSVPFDDKKVRDAILTADTLGRSY